MDLTFANPAGFWFLLGIPAILAIHFLQSKARRIEISTLFLVDMLAEENRRGAVWTQLRQSAQMWWQLLAVLLIAWIALNPVWLKQESMQTVAMVFDQSYSMEAFRAGAIGEAERIIKKLDGAAARTEWYLISSDSTRPLIYRGDSKVDAVNALSIWHPDREGHDPNPALRRARDLVGPQGAVIYMTDHVDVRVPPDVVPVSVGHPTPNSGFTGIRFDRDQEGAQTWTASLLHHGWNPTTRWFKIEFDGRDESKPEAITLHPGRIMHISGVIPPGVRSGRLVLNPDALPIDDTFHFVVPVLKPVTFNLTGFSHIDDWAGKVMSATEHASRTNVNPSLSWWTFTGRSVPVRGGNGIWLYTGDGEADYGMIMAMDHSLTRDLNWSGFLGRVVPGFERMAEDTVLVWMGSHPLVVLRETTDSRQLILCFDPARSNADRLPAVILCMNRFIETIRENIDGYEAKNITTHQKFIVRHKASVIEDNRGEKRVYSINGPAVLYAPSWPGYLQVVRDDLVVMDAGVYFDDTAEANIMQAGTVLPGDGWVVAQRISNSRRDMLIPLWFALLGGAIIASWITGHAARNRGGKS
ncbi:MAG TPA: BatA domain-containing protein [Kiritimatiellia bacterium]|nr:BatA domain-containing protein [Kiritimatiellia bacterium]